MFHKYLHWLLGMILTSGLSPPTLADSLKAGTALVVRTEHSNQEICAALRSVGLYLDQHRQIILTHAQAEIEDRTRADAEMALDPDEFDKVGVRELIAGVADHRLAQLQGKLKTTTARLRDVYADGCLITRGWPGSAGDAREVMAEPRVELAAVRRDVQELSHYAPAEFKTPVFQCVGDFEICKGAISDEFGCGITFMICVGRQLIPFAAN